MLQRFLLVWLALLSLVAYLWPRWNVGFDPFAATGNSLGLLITVTMFAIGGLLPRDEIRQVLARWPTVLGGTLTQYATMPLLAWAIARLCGLGGDLLIGMVLVGAVPGAMASNVLTLTARGNVSYSVSLTTAATLVSPVMVPLALFLTLDAAVADPADLAGRAFVDLVTQVVAPVLVGHWLSRRFARVERAMRAIGPVVANLAILWIIAVVVNLNHSRLSHAEPVLFAALAGLNLLGYMAGSFAGAAMRLPDANRRALTLEIGMQNAGLGAALARQLFEGRELAALPPALYTFGCMLTGTVLAQLWASRPLGSSSPIEAPAPGDLETSTAFSHKEN
ncbi:MAG: bile acid:sodium symporter family protein [Planctomycetes bacterium]|nr:bile acid:sodium symporter family protein [Planctomycetota bacterium]